jgi:ribosomal protein S18 acetylase RimI-like enzyme
MQQLAQDPDLLQVVRLDQQLLAAGAGAVDVDRRVHPLPGDAAVKVHFHVAGALELLVDHQHYSTHDHDAQFLVIERAGPPVGRLYLHWRDGELRIVDVALLPDARGQGLGGALLVALMARAALEGRSVNIHVEQMNPAMRLYQRLGFSKIGEHGIHHLMRWQLHTG